jgi:stalled ribosome rescue protein Dom34
LRRHEAKLFLETEAAVAHHFHAVVWIDHSRARIFHFDVEEADKTVIKPDRAVRDIHHGAKRTGHRIAEHRKYFEEVTKAIADAGAILIVGPGEEKHELAKFIADKHPAIKTPYRGVQSSDHPTDGELLDYARRYVKAGDRMRPQT